MLSMPEAGWTTFQLNENNKYDLSYLTDVAFDWLTQAIHGLETMDVFSVHGFCEPGRMVCTVSYWSCYILFEEEYREPECNCFSQIHISMIDFCKNLYADILSNLDAWVHWNDLYIEIELEDGDESGFEELVLERRTELLKELDRLKKLINEREDCFGDNRCFF